jgi:hypothetical protein
MKLDRAWVLRHHHHQRSPGRRLFPVLLSCLWLAACGNVQVKADQPIGTATLKPTVEDKRAGLVGIAPEFTPKAYRRISVEIFTVTDKNIDGDDDKQFAKVMPVYLQAKLMTLVNHSDRVSRG